MFFYCKEYFHKKTIGEISHNVEKAYAIKHQKKQKLLLYTQVSKNRQFMYCTIVHEVQFNETHDGCSLACRTRPTYPALVLFAVLLCIAVHFLVMFLFGDASPAFCGGIALLLFVSATNAFWQANICAKRFSKLIGKLAEDSNGNR